MLFPSDRSSDAAFWRTVTITIIAMLLTLAQLEFIIVYMAAQPNVLLSACMAEVKQLLSFIVDGALLKRLDDFRFKHRFANRATAIKWLLEWALKQNPKPE